MKPSVSVAQPTSENDHIFSSKITATLLICIDVAVIFVISSQGGSGITEMPLWTVCLIAWCLSLVLITVGIWTDRTILFVPAYIVWAMIYMLSVLFIIIDAYANIFCDKTLTNRTNQWNSPCDALIRRRGSFSCYFLLILLKHTQIFHARTLSQEIGAKLGSKMNVSKPRKDPDSDDDDMIVFEKIAGAFKGDRPKINDMGRASIA
ncbi:hypothetical protein V3C99_015726 [Haemonchus contortus]